MKSLREVRHGGVALCTQSFGSSTDPAIVLVMGATASMLWWPETLCRALADGGRFVIRFDHRDTGASTTAAPGEASYEVGDLADDVLAILDAYGIAQAHLAGMSLGAYVSQLLALRNPGRVLSLALVSAEPLGGETLPPMDMSPAFLAHFEKMGEVDWTSREDAAAFLEQAAALASSQERGHDRVATAERIAGEFERSPNLRSAFNHSSVGGDLGMWDLREISQPTVVIHGAHDPIIPVAHGEAIARQISSARLVVLPDAGHELHTLDLPLIAHTILENTRRERA
ncbi:MAG: alpha/beta hydrolase [Burkholderiaceae bacterium]